MVNRKDMTTQSNYPEFPDSCPSPRSEELKGTIWDYMQGLNLPPLHPGATRFVDSVTGLFNALLTRRVEEVLDRLLMHKRTDGFDTSNEQTVVPVFYIEKEMQAIRDELKK